jgi:hypothetical protein
MDMILSRASVPSFGREATPELERRPFDQDLRARPPPEPYDERYLRLRNHGLAMLHSYVAEMEAEEATAKVNQQAAP